jgi:transposase InsO family protein
MPSTPLGGHSGAQGTYVRIKKHFVWRGMKGDVTNFVKQCDICQHAKHEQTHHACLLHPLPVPAGAWQDISLDFIEGLPTSDGFNSILVVVDRFSKYAHFIPRKHPFSAQQVAQVMLNAVIRLHGVPKTIVSDRDMVFTSLFWKEMFKLFNTTLLMSTAYYPQTDGQTERVN